MGISKAYAKTMKLEKESLENKIKNEEKIHRMIEIITNTSNLKQSLTLFMIKKYKVLFCKLNVSGMNMEKNHQKLF